MRLVEAMAGPDDVAFFRAPGRVNLMGGHTDYNERVFMTHGKPAAPSRHRNSPSSLRAMSARAVWIAAEATSIASRASSIVIAS